MSGYIERVLVVPTTLLAGFLDKIGLITASADEITAVIMQNCRFMDRPVAENSPEFRQIIPYVAVICGDEIFGTQRLAQSGEARLHGKISLGIGGHINPETDGDGADVLMRGLVREINEELFAEGIDMSTLQFRGYINDDTNEVGRVHLGMFCTVHSTKSVSVRETDKLCGEWYKIAALHGVEDKMETWSALVIDEI